MFKRSLFIIATLVLCSCGSNPKKESSNDKQKTQIVEPTKESIPMIKPDSDIGEIKEETEIAKQDVEPVPKVVVKSPEPIVKPQDQKNYPKTNQEISPVKKTTSIKTHKQPKTIKPKNSNKLIGKLSFSNKSDAKLDASIVYFKPDDEIYPPIKAKSVEIKTINKRFEPSVLAIPIGSEVKFPNLDRILHNVFSVSPETSFDLGLYSAGTVKTVKFDKAGIIYVHCNVHHSMQADILVLDTPWYSHVNQDGSFQLEDLPNKKGKLYIWHPRAKLSSQIVDTSVKQEINSKLKITRQKVPKHLNKFGKSYRPSRK